MPGGKRDSSKTRVAPVFTLLQSRKDDWVRRLLTLPTDGQPDARVPANGDFNLEQGYWGQNEKAIPPPFSLLTWLVNNPKRLRHSTSTNAHRQALLNGEPQAVRNALEGLQERPVGRSWYVLEGATYPDALLMTRSAIVVVEGKRTEAGPTVETSWLAGRHQIWRHIDAAWEIRGARQVYGMFIVEGDAGGIPTVWKMASRDSFSATTLASSFPHRDAVEREAISRCFLGVTTWQSVCDAFGIDFSKLPRTTDDLAHT